MSRILSGCIQRSGFDSPWWWVTLYVDKLPKLVYERVFDTYFFGYDKETGLFSSYVWAPDSRDGFGGAQIKLELTDGSLWEPEGGTMWSSAQAQCAHYYDLGPYMGVSVMENPERYVGMAYEWAISDYVDLWDGDLDLTGETRRWKYPDAYLPRDFTEHRYRASSEQVRIIES